MPHLKIVIHPDDDMKMSKHVEYILYIVDIYILFMLFFVDLITVNITSQ